MENPANEVLPKALVSVIMPVYNSEHLLPLCIESIVRQTHRDLEILFINDGSTDRSGEICDGYAKRDSRIRVIHTENGGPAAARNVGIQDSKGDFMVFVDADDTIEERAIERMIECQARSNADTIVGDFWNLMGDRLGPGHKGAFEESRLMHKDDVLEYARCYLRKPNRFTLFAYSWGRLFRSSIIRDHGILFDPELHTFEDVAFNFAYMFHANEVYYLKDPLYTHRVHDNYMSATMMITDNPRRMFGYPQALAGIGRYLKSCGSGEGVEKQVGHAYVCLTIIQFVRICSQLASANRAYIHRLVQNAVLDPNLRANLRHYSPTDNDSRVVPILMRLGLVWPTIYVCRYKGRKRYGKKGAAKWLSAGTPSKKSGETSL